MSEPQKSGSQETTPGSSGNYETTLDESKRKTGDDEKSDAKPTATPCMIEFGMGHWGLGMGYGALWIKSFSLISLCSLK